MDGGGRPSLVLEWCRLILRSLWTSAAKFLDFADVRCVGKQLCEGLAHMHAQGYAHRDVSMANILVSARPLETKAAQSEFTVKIADFGTATPAVDKTMPGPCTSLFTRAPEVFFITDPSTPDDVGELKDAPTTLDMWSVGVIARALFVGEYPFYVESKGQETTATLSHMLKQMVEVLGPPPAEYHALPLWSKVARGVPLRQGQQSAREALAGERSGPRPLPPQHPAVGLLADLLVWTPRQRLRAVAAAGHPAWSPPGEASDPNGTHFATPPTSGARVSPSLTHRDSAAQDDTCQCSGNCGRPQCALEKKRGNVPACARARVRRGGLAGVSAARPGRQPYGDRSPSDRFCDVCVCDVKDCAHVRASYLRCNGVYCKTSGRWCAKHEALLADKMKRPTSTYLTRAGLSCAFPAAWPWALRVVARHGWALREMCPCDLRAFLDAAPVVVDVGAAELSGFDLASLFNIAYLKWPPAIAHWAERTGRQIEARKDPAFLHEQSLELARHLNQKDYSWMHRQISTNRMVVVMGAQQWLRRLGVMAKVECDAVGTAGGRQVCPQPAQRKRTRGKRPAESEAEGDPVAPKVSRTESAPESRMAVEAIAPEGRERVSLSSSSKGADVLHVLCPEPSVWCDLVEVAKETRPIKRPMTKDAVRTFVAEVSEFLRRLPDQFGLGESGDTYVHNHVLRKIVLATVPLEIRGLLTVEEVERICPDENRNVAGIPKYWTGERIEEHFGIELLMVSCWACLAGAIPEKQREIFERASGRDLLALHIRMTRAHNGVEPSLATIAAELVDGID